MTQDDHDLLMRIDERTEALCEKFDAMNERLDSEFVTQKEFWPVKTIVYGGAAIILIGVLTAIIALVVRGGG